MKKTNSLTSQSIQVRYSLLNGTYWMLFGVTIVFVNSYLSGLNIGTDVIGLVSAFFAGAAALMQTAFARLAEKHKKINWKSITILLVVLRLVSNILLMTNKNPSFSAIIFGLSLFSIHTMLPFVNAANFYYESHGYKLNYGVARGVGSLFFAIMTIIVGNYVARIGIDAILIVGLVCSILMLISIFLMPYFNKDDTVLASGGVEVRENIFKEYPRLAIMLIAFCLIMAFHNSFNTYLLQLVQKVGGGNAELGNAMFIAAAFEIPIMFGFSKLLKLMSPYKMILISSIFFIVKGLMYYFSPSIMWIYLAQILQLVTFALFISAAVYYAQQEVKEKDMQLGQSLFASSVTLGSVFGSLSGGYIINKYGLDTNMLINVGMVVVSSIIIILIGERKKAR